MPCTLSDFRAVSRRWESGCDCCHSAAATKTPWCRELSVLGSYTVTDGRGLGQTVAAVVYAITFAMDVDTFLIANGGNAIQSRPNNSEQPRIRLPFQLSYLRWFSCLLFALERLTPSNPELRHPFRRQNQAITGCGIGAVSGSTRSAESHEASGLVFRTLDQQITPYFVAQRPQGIQLPKA